MNITVAIQVVQRRLNTVRRVHALIPVSAAIALFLVIALALAFLHPITGVAFFTVSTLAVLFLTWERGWWHASSTFDATVALDAFFKTEERVLTVHELASDPERAGARDFIESQLQARLSAFDVKQLAPFIMNTGEKVAVALVGACLLAVMILTPRLLAHLRPPAEVARVLLEALIQQQPDLPQPVVERLQELAQALTSEQLSSEEVRDALERAESEIEREREKLQEAVSEKTLTQEISGTEAPSPTSTPGQPSPSATPTPNPISQTADAPKDTDVQHSTSADSQEGGKQEKQQSTKPGDKGSEGQSGKEEGKDAQGSKGQKEESGGKEQSSSQKQGGGDGAGQQPQQKPGQSQDGQEGGDKGDGKDGDSQGQEGGKDQKDQQGKQDQQGKEGGAKGGAGDKNDGAGQKEGGQGQAAAALAAAKQALDQVEKQLEQEKQQQQQGAQGGDSGKRPGDAQQPKGSDGPEKSGDTPKSKDQNGGKGEKGNDGQKKNDQNSESKKKDKPSSKPSGDKGDTNPGDNQNPDSNNDQKSDSSALGKGGRPVERYGEGGDKEGLGDRKAYQEAVIKEGGEQIDARFAEQGGELRKNAGDAKPRTAREERALAKPEISRDRGEQPIPLEYRDVLQ